MNYFLAKTEPSTYSIDNLESDVTTIWDGVHNYQAINVIKSMEVGDQVYIYHSMTDKKIVGLAEVVGAPFQNLKDTRHSWAMKIKFMRRFDGPSLADFKSEPGFSQFKLVSHSRLSVMPVPVDIATWINQRSN